MNARDTAASAQVIDNTTAALKASSLFSLSDPLHDQCDLRDAGTRWDAAGLWHSAGLTEARMPDEVKQAFQQRPHFVENATGFVRMDVLSPCDAPDEIWLITYWDNEASYRTWHRGHLYQESHRGIPKGLRLVPHSVSIRFFNHVAS